MEESSLSYKTLKNISFSFLGYVLPIAFSIFITPVVVHKLGVTDYGVYVLVNTITGLLLLMDLGLGSSFIKYTAEYHSKKDFESLSKLLNSGNLIFFIFGLLGLLIFFVLGRFFLFAFHITITSQSHITTVFLLAGILFLVNSMNMIFISILRALQRYDLNVSLGLSQLVVFNLLTLAAVLVGYKLKAILLLNILTTAALLAVQYWYCASLLPEIRLGFGWHSEEVRKSYRFGIAAFVTNLSSSALIQIDRLIVPLFLGPVPLTYYSLPGNVAQKVNGVTGASTGIFFPMITSLTVSGDMEKIKAIYRKLFRNVTVITAAMTVPILFFARKILLFWLGADFARQGTIILIILTLTYFLLGLYGPFINFLMGLGKVRFLMKISVFMAVLNIILLLVLVPWHGIVGAAYAYLGAVLPVVWAFYFVERHYLQFFGQWRFYTRLYAKIFFTAAVFVLVALAINPWVQSLTAIIIVGPLTVALFLALYWLFGFFEDEDIELLKSFLAKLKTKVSLNSSQNF